MKKLFITKDLFFLVILLQCFYYRFVLQIALKYFSLLITMAVAIMVLIQRFITA